MANVLVFVETQQSGPKKASLSAITFGQQVAQKSGGKLFLALLGQGVGAHAAHVNAYGAEKIYVVDRAELLNPLAESYTAALHAVQKACGAEVVAAASSSTSKDFLPRLAAKLGAGMASDVLAVVDDKTFKRPMWAGNVVATVELTTPVRVCSVRATEFAAPEGGKAESATEAVQVELDLAQYKSKVVEHREVKSERPDVTSAARVVSGGRGVKGIEGFKLVEQLADKLGAGVGASRAVCDAGWVPNDLQIGQTGKVVAPNLYVAVGISGAIQHLAGMKGSKVIVAINKDPEAPIFQVADYGLVADLFTVMPELMQAIG